MCICIVLVHCIKSDSIISPVVQMQLPVEYFLNFQTRLNIPLVGIYLVEPHLDLFIRSKHQSSRHNQPRQSRQRTTPERQHTLVLEDSRCALEAISISLVRFDTLHARLDCVERLRNKHGDQTGQTTNGKGSHGAKLLAGCCVRLGHLLEEVVGCESCRAVGGLSGGRGGKALEETSDASLAGDDGDGVEEAAQPRFGGLAVVDSQEC